MIEITTEFATELIRAFDLNDSTTLRRMVTYLEKQVVNSGPSLVVKKKIKLPNLSELKNKNG